jgi:hypothetical protein
MSRPIRVSTNEAHYIPYISDIRWVETFSSSLGNAESLQSAFSVHEDYVDMQAPIELADSANEYDEQFWTISPTKSLKLYSQLSQPSGETLEIQVFSAFLVSSFASASVNWLNGSTSWVSYQDGTYQLRESGPDDYPDQLSQISAQRLRISRISLPPLMKAFPVASNTTSFQVLTELQTPLGQIEPTYTLDTSLPISSGWFLDTLGPAFLLIAILFIGIVLHFANAVTSWLLPWLALTAQLPFEANYSLHALDRAGFLVTRFTHGSDCGLELLWVVSLGLVVAMPILWTDPFLTVLAPILTVSLIALMTRYRSTIQRVLLGRALLSCFKAMDTFISVPLQVTSISVPLQAVNSPESKASQLVVNTKNLCWWSNAAQEVRKSRREWAYSLIAQLAIVFVVQAFLIIDYLSSSTDTKSTTISVGLALNSLWIWAIPILGWTAMRHMSHSRIRSKQIWGLGTISTSAGIIDILRPSAPQRIIQSFGSTIGRTALANSLFHKLDFAVGNLEEGVLSLEGCTAICGSGYDLREWSDTFNRLSLLVLPTLLLIAHLAFPAKSTSNTCILYSGPGTEDGSSFASLFLKGPWSSKELITFKFIPHWLQRNHCLTKDQDLLIPDRTILQSGRDDDLSVSAVSPENEHVRFKNADGEEAGPKCVASILGLPSAISILSNLTAGLHILAITCVVLGAVMTIALRSDANFHGSNVITDPFSPSRNEAASNIYVVPESSSLTIGAAAGLTTACCIPAVLLLVFIWNINFGINWKSRDGGVSGSVFSSLLIPYTDIFRPDIQTRSWKSIRTAAIALAALRMSLSSSQGSKDA